MRALITGITGQDGSYLAEYLAAAGHEVFGLVRGQSLERRDRLTALVPTATLIEGDLLDSGSLANAVAEAAPDVIWNLAAISAPAACWSQPVVAGEVNGLGFLRLLQAVRQMAPKARVVQAGSIARHGQYGAAKDYATAIAADYRLRGMHVSVAVMAGHHSPRRGTEFFSRHVSRAAARIAAEPLSGKVNLGWLGRDQDWGWAPNFAQGLAAVADADPGDYTLATSDPHTCQEWVEECFAAAGLDWVEHVVIDAARSQPTDVPTLTADPDPRLPWEPVRDFPGLARWMVRADFGVPE
jgi:GDPmannose 4,6-dehydratase